jgi:hypothetical protein
MSTRGQFRVLREVCAEDMGMKQFLAYVVKPLLANEFSGYTTKVVGDPAGSRREDSDEREVFQELRDAGFAIEAARTNNFMARREAVASFLNRMVDGQPGFLLDPSCKVLRSGFGGGYAFRRLRISGEEARYTDVPDKNKYSHPHDALQYVALEFAEPKVEKRRRARSTPLVADSIGAY